MSRVTDTRHQEYHFKYTISAVLICPWLERLMWDILLRVWTTKNKYHCTIIKKLLITTVPNMKTFTITNPHRTRLVSLTLQFPLLLSSSTLILLPLVLLLLRPTSNSTNKDTASATIPTITTVVEIKAMKAAEAFQRLWKAPSRLCKKKVCQRIWNYTQTIHRFSEMNNLFLCIYDGVPMTLLMIRMRIPKIATIFIAR